MNDVPCVLFTVANKVAFMEAGAVPAMMRLMDRGPNDPITAIALDAVTILAEDNDEVDEAVARTGVLQRVVEMISNPENPKLTNAAVTAVMHMARDYMDAKRMLTTAGVIPKLKPDHRRVCHRGITRERRVGADVRLELDQHR